ncbi:acyltransferase [Uliginosibacterium sp. H3]|uniref:Acyltransferase n=1 Tax=Uliginosibacterium silvisoli TaxID=3114758 RepID=A0ABU6JZ12_9RHOO|nr:acyltransferase [Uliginosibacterium sp. H3]
MHRFTTLDGMRGVAALAVVILHVTQHTSRAYFAGAALAVDLFFCLSGFVIAHSYLDRLNGSMSAGEFILRRVVRLYPMFFIGLCIGAAALLVKSAMGQTSLDGSQAVAAILLNAAYLPYIADFFVIVGKDAIPSAIFPTNDPAWSLFFEFVANLLFCLAALKATQLRFLILSVIGVVWLAIWQKTGGDATPGWGAENLQGGFPRVVLGFFSGVVVHHVFRRYERRLPVINSLSLMLVLCLVLWHRWSAGIWFLSAVLLAPLLVLLGAASTTKSAILVRSFNYLGWISYPIYCLHFPIYSLFTSLTHEQNPGLLAAAVCIPVSWAIAHLATKHIEEPVRRRLANVYPRVRPKGLRGSV